MARSLVLARTGVALTSVAALGMIGVGQQVFAGAPQGSTAAPCAAAGVYMVGQAYSPIHPGKPGAGAPRLDGSQAHGPAVIAVLPRGSLVVVTYAGCGQTTRGSFSVRFGLLPAQVTPRQAGAPSIMRPMRGETMSGTFVQATGATRATPASAVVVKAVMDASTTQSDGRTAVAHTAFTATGRLEVSDDYSSAVLTFTQPGSGSRTTIALYGRRGPERPLPGNE